MYVWTHVRQLVLTQNSLEIFLNKLTQAFFGFGVVAPSILENAVYDVTTFSIVTQSRGKEAAPKPG